MPDRTTGTWLAAQNTAYSFLPVKLYEGLYYRIRFDGILPAKTTARCNLLCEDLEEAIRRYIAQHSLTIPIYQTAMVIFCHYYKSAYDRRVWITDYDNLERKSVVDTLVPWFLPDDNPRVMRTMDMMLEGESDYSEILIMTCDAFRVFIYKENFSFQDCNTAVIRLQNYNFAKGLF